MTPRKETQIATRQAVINMRESGMRGTEIAMSFDDTDKLYENGKAREAYEILKKKYNNGEKGVEILWRLAQCCNELAEDNQGSKRTAFLEEGLKYTSAGIEINPNHGKILKWAAIITGQHAALLPMKKRIEAGQRLEVYLNKAIAIESADHVLLHLRGRFRFQVASLSWLERKFASTFFASVPSATYEEARDDFLAAKKLWAEWVENHLYLGKCYLALKDKENARKALNDALALETVSAKDAENKDEAKALLAKL